MKKIYSGWVSVGMYDNKEGKWKSRYLQGLDKPKNIKNDDLYVVKTGLYGRKDAPSSCVGFHDWLKTEETTTFYELQLIKVVEVLKFEACDKQDQTRVFAKITDGRQ